MMTKQLTSIVLLTMCLLAVGFFSYQEHPPAPREIIRADNVEQLTVIDRWGQGNVYGVTLSPDEKTLAVATTTGIYLYDRATLTQKQWIDLPIVRNNRFSPNKAISFSPDGKFLALGYEDIVIWNLSENKIERRIEHQIEDYTIVQLAFSPNGKTMVALSMGGYTPCDSLGGNFALYEIMSNSILYNDYFCPAYTEYNFTFINNDRVVFSGVSPTEGYQASIVHTLTGSLFERISFESSIIGVNFDGSQILLRVPAQKTTRIIDTVTKNIVDDIDGQIIFFPYESNLFLLFHEKSWVLTNLEDQIVCAFESYPSFSPGTFGTTLDFSKNHLIWWDKWEQSMKIWNTTDCQLTQKLFLPVGDNSLMYSSDGHLLSTQDWYYIHLWDGVSGKHQHSIQGNFNSWPTQYYGLSANADVLVTTSTDFPYSISLWNGNTGEGIKTIPTNLNFAHSISISPDGYIAATVDSEVNLWDLENGTLIRTYHEKSREVFFNPTSTQFAMGVENKVVIRSTVTGKVVQTIFVDHLDYKMVFSSDWKYLAVVTDKIELWEPNGTKPLRLLETHPVENKTKITHFYDVEFSPDNSLLVALYSNSDIISLYFWDVGTGKIVHKIQLPFRGYEMAFKPDGKTLAILSDGVIYHFGIPAP